jgi:hypothetical protein
VNDEDIGNASDNAERLQDRGLDGFAITTIRRMEGEDPGCTASAQMLKHGTLNHGLRTLAVTGAAHDAPPA